MEKAKKKNFFSFLKITEIGVFQRKKVIIKQKGKNTPLHRPFIYMN